MAADQASPEGLETVNVYQIDRARQKLLFTQSRIGTAALMPLDRLALHSDPPRLQRVRFDQTGMQWGAAGFRLAGAVEIDAAGLANGHVTVQVETWRDLLELARANALFDDGDMAFVGTLMERFAGTADGESRLELPIQIEDNIFRIGMMRFGPFPPVLWDSISGAGQD